MKSTRITKKLNKLAKNKTSKKCKLEKRVSKKHVKRSREKKSRKMRGGATSVMGRAAQFGEVVNRRPPEPAGKYEEAFAPISEINVASTTETNPATNPTLSTTTHTYVPMGGEFGSVVNINAPRQNKFYEMHTLNQNGNVKANSNGVVTEKSAYDTLKRDVVELSPYYNSQLEQPQTEDELKLFYDVVAKIIKLLGIKPTAVKDIQTALNKLSSLSAEELSKLQAELEKLIDKYQPLYEPIHEGNVRVYETIKNNPTPLQEQNPPPIPPPRTFRNPSYEQSPESNCSNKSKEDCKKSPKCKLVKTKSRGKLGFSRIISTCVKKKTITPQTYEEPRPVKQTGVESPYLEPD